MLQLDSLAADLLLSQVLNQGPGAVTDVMEHTAKLTSAECRTHRVSHILPMIVLLLQRAKKI